jgi:hypothetical protein
MLRRESAGHFYDREYDKMTDRAKPEWAGQGKPPKPTKPEKEKGLSFEEYLGVLYMKGGPEQFASALEAYTYGMELKRQYEAAVEAYVPPTTP